MLFLDNMSLCLSADDDDDDDVVFRDRRESPASSWGLMGNPCTLAAWEEHRYKPLKTTSHVAYLHYIQLVCDHFN